LDSSTDRDGSLDASTADAATSPDASSPRDARTDGATLRDAGCTVDAGPMCDGQTRVQCTGDGGLERRDCPLGCSGGQCQLFTPSNVPDMQLFDAADGNAVVPQDTVWVFDADSGSITAYDDLAMTGESQVRAAGTGTDGSGIAFFERGPGGADYGVFALASLEVRSGAVAVGLGSRPWIVVAGETIRVDGRISAAADELSAMSHSGPGALTTPADGSQGFRASGAAGGSFGSSGGEGGWSLNHSGGTPGSTRGTVELVPLVGGTPGGASPRTGGESGPPGGAMQLVAGRRIEVGSTGAIEASGGGGGGGQLATDPGGGGGGGSGGAILLEAPVIELQGVLGANGGAGGQGSSASMSSGEAGARGRADRVPAPGSATANNAGGGGSGSDATGSSGNGQGASDSGGGGGGGAGRIRINTADGTESFDVGVTPTPTSGLTTIGQVTR
jgi:hypothetical protein